MADAGFQLVLDALARVVGGTVTPADSHFYSGDQVQDSTGIAGVKGCYSVKPTNLQSTPVGVIIADRFSAPDPLQGEQEVEDWVKLVLYVAKSDDKNAGALINSFRDLVPTTFHSHMQAFGAANIDVHIASGQAVLREWGAIRYFAWDFSIRVRRLTHDLLTV